MTATVVPFRDHLAGPIRDPLRVLLGAVLLVLLLGCANVASLLLSSAAARQREFACAPRLAQIAGGSFDRLWSKVSSSRCSRAWLDSQSREPRSMLSS